eukprot:scaffold803_cov310-Pinguiococcus_pyrenoidosus.AAC.194
MPSLPKTAFTSWAPNPMRCLMACSEPIRSDCGMLRSLARPPLPSSASLAFPTSSRACSRKTSRKSTFSSFARASGERLRGERFADHGHRAFPIAGLPRFGGIDAAEASLRSVPRSAIFGPVLVLLLGLRPLLLLLFSLFALHLPLFPRGFYCLSTLIVLALDEAAMRRRRFPLFLLDRGLLPLLHHVVVVFQPLVESPQPDTLQGRLFHPIPQLADALLCLPLLLALLLVLLDEDGGPLVQLPQSVCPSRSAGSQEDGVEGLLILRERPRPGVLPGGLCGVGVAERRYHEVVVVVLLEVLPNSFAEGLGLLHGYLQRLERVVVHRPLAPVLHYGANVGGASLPAALEELPGDRCHCNRDLEPLGMLLRVARVEVPERLFCPVEDVLAQPPQPQLLIALRHGRGARRARNPGCEARGIFKSCRVAVFNSLFSSVMDG